MYVFPESMFPLLSLNLSLETCLERNFPRLSIPPSKSKTDSENTLSCHDWPDDECVRFLSHTATAMEKGYSSLLIREYVVPETGASLRTAAKDIQMMGLFAGMERTESQWMNLLSLSGLRLVKIWSSRNGMESVIEATITH